MRFKVFDLTSLLRSRTVPFSHCMGVELKCRKSVQVVCWQLQMMRCVFMPGRAGTGLSGHSEPCDMRLHYPMSPSLQYHQNQCRRQSNEWPYYVTGFLRKMQFHVFLLKSWFSCETDSDSELALNCLSRFTVVIYFSK